MASLHEIQRIVERIKEDLPALISRSQITPKQIVVATGLSDISERLGLVQAGEFRAGNGKEPGLGFTGVRIGYPAFVYSGNTWHIVGVNNDVIQFGIRATDGVAIAGGGTVTLTDSGVFVEVAAIETYDPIHAYNFIYNTETIGGLFSFVNGVDMREINLAIRTDEAEGDIGIFLSHTPATPAADLVAVSVIEGAMVVYGVGSVPAMKIMPSSFWAGIFKDDSGGGYVLEIGGDTNSDGHYYNTDGFGTRYGPAVLSIPIPLSGGTFTTATASIASNNLVINFPDATTPIADWNIGIPIGWGGKSLQIDTWWAASSGSGNAVVNAEIRSIAAGGTLGAPISSQGATLALTTTIQKRTWTLTAPADGNAMTLRIYRSGTNAGDTLTTSALLLGILIR